MKYFINLCKLEGADSDLGSEQIREPYLLLSLTQLPASGKVDSEECHDAVDDLRSYISPNCEIPKDTKGAHKEPEVLVLREPLRAFVNELHLE